MPEDGGKVGVMAVANADALWASRRAAGALRGRSEMDLHGSLVCCSRLVEGRAAATAERLRRLRRRQAAACPYSICRMRRLSSWQAAAA